MENGWTYLQRFTTGVLEAAGRKSRLKHVLVTLQPDVVKNILQCFIDGSVEADDMKDIPVRSEFMVRIKCVDKDAGIYLTAKGKACIKQIGHGKKGLQVKMDVKIFSVAAYKKVVDENGIDSLEPLYNDLSPREEKRAKIITAY
jgi:hypothetical protein